MAWDLVGLAKGAIDLLKIWLSRKKPSDAMIDAINIRLLAEDIVDSERGLSVDCFFIVMIHNHGGPVRPHNFIFWSIIDGYYNELTMPNFKYKNHRLLNMEIDFLQLATRIHEQQGVAVTVDKMDKGKLRTLFDYEGLKYLRFLYLKQNKRAMWFIMVGTTEEKETLDDVEHEGKIFIAFNSIKNIIRGY
jgi:hypothetical protein